MRRLASVPTSSAVAPRRSVPATARKEPEFFSAQISSAQRFFLDLAPKPARELVVVCGGREHCEADYHVHRADFAYYSIEFVARGEGTLQLHGKDYPLVPGVIFAYGPGIAQDIRCNPQKPLVKYFVDFVGQESQQLLRPPGPEPGQIVQSSSPDQILRIFDDLVGAGMRQTPFTARICAAILEQLLLRVAESAVAMGTIGSLAFETYQQCRQFIDAHYLEVSGLAEIVDRCHIDPAYLCRLFARFDHQSPYRYLLRLKMQHAAQRLQEPGILAKQVAMELGFSDAFQFSRTFHRIIGVSPRQFMQMQRPVPAAGRRATGR